ncbi:transmembrane and ubiquitin-like domain-containing protein 1 [Trichoplusia ni]|uniref:Transmembrane and ubiquitin-like domain-containing protein 1 n=1 Tax=Trichoplusia ni TaxID=7111 RepID=A0A7E5WVT7_TRINI|nr:transmembrane and ubiquitin-like domain-containing protein 1 [Trichoplusia ni]XP_026744407.1 transmembrane and ubiquitin-like domain-containing protein 1 [Trichoplusia ni]XP_026744408.1 transmembrane and ubiquitin-like domain-containing protein 1 [Trichoplusia ni]XP_026744409.1 transmembrane and ubiquitin-like domain-containing protein 1 [Trichoplusia ni]
MTLIDGVGDEVVQFIAVVLVVVVAALAWLSTNARPDRYQTVLVMRSRTHHPVTVSIRTRSNLMLSTTQTNSTMQVVTSDTPGAGTETTEENNARVIPLQEMDSIVDADMAMLDNNRLHFYRRIDSPSSPNSPIEQTNDESEPHEEVEPASNAQIREMDSIVSAMEADVTTGCDFFTRANESNSSSVIPTTIKKDDVKEANAPSTANVQKTSESVNTENAQSTENVGDAPTEQDTRKILIKLKYLNDTLKEVDGSLDELLKDFKWRHFSSELTAESRVRLIFNGRVLIDDAATLRACGLHDRAVVHCLVHPKRTTSQPRGTPEEPAVNPPMTEGAQPERAWDLENILMTLVSVALTVVWFFRCEYSNMFTASASVALFGLTVFYSVAIFGLYLSDTFQFDRRPAQPVPNN